MLTDKDKQWLWQAYPCVQEIGGEVNGTVDFTAVYDAKLNQFSIIYDASITPKAGILLQGSFGIRIIKRAVTTSSVLPALFVEGVEPLMDRHFNQTDHSACLCSPLEEPDFLQPTFEFKRFFEHLVIPFLYGQLFYTKEKLWPWPDLAHGSTGLLESFYRLGAKADPQDCLDNLSKYSDWPRVRTVLMQKDAIKGHTFCFCLNKDHIRRCHPEAWQGAIKLREYVRLNKIQLPIRPV